MIIFIIIGFIFLAWFLPRTFRYLFLVPTMGLAIGGFAWSLVGLLITTNVVTFRWFSIFVICGCFYAARLVKKHLS